MFDWLFNWLKWDNGVKIDKKTDVPWLPIGFFFSVTFCGLFVFYFYATEHYMPEIIISLMLIVGVIAVMVCLAFTTVVFKSLGLADSTRSLGLPEGSMQAVIAICLILIFVLSSLLLFEEVYSHGIVYSKNITQEQLDDIPKDEIVKIDLITRENNISLFNVARKFQADTVSEDMAKQILTTVSTLVVAVAGFYFGSKAVEGAKSAVQATSDPIIRSIKPQNNEGKRDEKIPFEILGKNFDLPKVRLIQESNKIEVDDNDITSNSTKIRCIFTIPPKSDKYPDGKWTVVVINSDKSEDQLKDAFTIN